MSDEPEMPKTGGQPPPEFLNSPAAQKARNITTTQFSSFLNELAPGRLCLYCGQSEYFVPTDPEGSATAIISAPVPHIKGVGVWLYMLVCPTCGHTALFNTHLVAPKIDGAA